MKPTVSFLNAGAILLALACGLSARASEDANGSKRAVLDWNADYWHYLLSLRSPEYASVWKDRKGREVRYLNYQRGWHIGYSRSRISLGEIPEAWTQPGFDDSGWVVKKGGPEAGAGWYDQIVRVACVRGRFEVPDPGKVTGLVLEARYIGGLAVFLNGKEVARKHLPEGPLNGDTMADGYPDEAYAWGIPLNKHNYPQSVSEWKAPDEKSERVRTVRIAIDPKLLAKGTNVLSLSFHRAGYGPPAGQWSYEAMNGYKNTPWPHFTMLDCTLCAEPEGSARALAPAASSALWSADIHRRLVNRDTGARSPAVLRMVGARNGVYSGQAVLETGQDRGALQAQVSDLVLAGGQGRIPASAVSVRYGVGTPLASMREAPWGRHGSYYSADATRLLESYAFGTGNRFRNQDERVNPSKEVQEEAKKIELFDALSDTPPAQLAAGNCQPIWVSVRIPKDAAAGLYTGTLTVNADKALTAEIRLQVADWVLPDGKDLASFVGLQQSLEPLAAHYKCARWSDEHWALLERSTALLSEIGNDLAVLPLTCGGEAANEESLVTWTKQGDGYAYEWKNFDRYLALIEKYWGRNTAIVGEICWVPYTSKGWVVIQPGVSVAADGKVQKTELPAPGSEEWKKVFIPFARAVHERLKSKGFERFYWGWFYDNSEPLLPMAKAMAEALPSVGWARASHNGFGSKPLIQGADVANLDMHIRGFSEPFTKEHEPISHRGWKNAGNLLFPRVASQIQSINSVEAPMALRWLPENCLVNGAAGFGRMGADYFPPFQFANWYHPFVNYLLAPGPKGALATVRFEALREGLQEAEVRIALERADKDATEPAKSVLAARIHAIGALPTGASSSMSEYYGGWQERSWDLYSAAAAAFGGKAPSEKEKQAFFAAPGR